MSTDQSWNALAAEDVDSPLILRKRVKETAEMDITPMIDITFLLLIFFLVCSTMDKQDTVALAEARYGVGVNDRNAVVITVEDKGDGEALIYLGDGTTGVPLGGDSASQEEAITMAVEEGQRNGKQLVLFKTAGNLRRREVDRIEAAAGAVEGMKLCHAVTEER